jgi:hypothetical protein
MIQGHLKKNTLDAFDLLEIRSEKDNFNYIIVFDFKTVSVIGHAEGQRT